MVTTPDTGQITVLPMTAEMIPQVVAMHLAAFRGSMSAQLGPLYVRPLIKWFVDAPDSIALVASLDGRTPHGYVMGAPLGYTRRTNWLLLVPAILAGLTHPWLAFDRRIRKTAATRLRMLAGHKFPTQPCPELPAPTMSLVGIGVAPQAQRRNVGRLLVNAFEAAALELGMRSLRLSVFPENNAARSLYEKCGWQPFREPSEGGVTMFYSKVLDGRIDSP